jgi:F-type H+-transporting ATPase subunit c
MEAEALKFIGMGLTTIGMLGAALGVGQIFVAVVNGIARNPSTQDQLAKYGLIGAAFAEAMGLFALVIALIIMYS